ncbi:unnamed protein product [Mesocestoides corti]|uniref:THAP-type domain-containing protein n=1 Tax=Mesocestoides corti TaxID=53468 RepID=A0A0R3UGM8_MESCO|nr:unnamed protein product [Mesocestoides corti]
MDNTSNFPSLHPPFGSFSAVIEVDYGNMRSYHLMIVIFYGVGLNKAVTCCQKTFCHTDNNYRPLTTKLQFEDAYYELYDSRNSKRSEHGLQLPLLPDLWDVTE